MARCNLPPEERKGILRNYSCWEHSIEELEECRRFFENYMFVENLERDCRCACSFCGEYWPDERGWHKHNDFENCPYCGRRLQVKQIGKLRSGRTMYQTEAVSFINVLPDGAVTIESGIAFYDYTCNYSIQWIEGTADPRMKIEFVGKKRYYMRPGAVMSWKRYIGSYFERMIYSVEEWEETKNINEPFSANGLYGFDGYGYFIGFEKLDDSALKYSQIDKYYRTYHDRNIYADINPLRLVPQYLAEYAMHPQIEMAVKLGMEEAVGELVWDRRLNAADINWKASSPEKFVRLTKAEAKEFFNAPSLDFLKFYHAAKASGKVKDIEAARKIHAVIGGLGEQLEKRAIDACERFGITLMQLVNRIKTQKDLMTWLDYTDMATTLEYDLTAMNDLFPKNLQERHDTAAENLRIRTNEEKERAYQKRREKLEKKYGFTADGLTIVVPSGIDDIVEEGKTLHICVGGYANRHVEGKTTILFLRHERRPERSFLCIELNDKGSIVQIHGYRNEGYPHSISPRIRYKDWLEQWQAWYMAGSYRDRAGNPIIPKERESMSA